MNKKIVFNSILVAAIMVLAYFQLKPKTTVAYLEINQVLTRYNGVKDAMEDFEKKKAVWEANIDTLKTELENSITEYEKKGQNMSLGKRRETEEFLQKKNLELKKYSDAVTQRIREEQKKITEKALQPADKLIKEYGKKHGYTIILGASQLGNILYADETVDLTDKIIDLLNEEYAK